MTSKYKLLFNYIKTLLPADYIITFGTQDINKENTIGVFFKGGIPENRVITTGEYLIKTASITFNVNSKKDYNSVMECMTMLEALKTALDTSHDIEHTEGIDSVYIAYFEAFGDINQLGFNEMGIPVFSLNYIAKYN